MANNIYFEKICAPPKDQLQRWRTGGHNTTGTMYATHIGHMLVEMLYDVMFIIEVGWQFATFSYLFPCSFVSNIWWNKICVSTFPLECIFVIHRSRRKSLGPPILTYQKLTASPALLITKLTGRSEQWQHHRGAKVALIFTPQKKKMFSSP